MRVGFGWIVVGVGESQAGSSRIGLEDDAELLLLLLVLRVGCVNLDLVVLRVTRCESEGSNGRIRMHTWILLLGCLEGEEGMTTDSRGAVGPAMIFCLVSRKEQVGFIWLALPVFFVGGSFVFCIIASSLCCFVWSLVDKFCYLITKVFIINLK